MLTKQHLSKKSRNASFGTPLSVMLQLIPFGLLIEHLIVLPLLLQ